MKPTAEHFGAFTVHENMDSVRSATLSVRIMLTVAFAIGDA